MLLYDTFIVNLEFQFDLNCLSKRTNAHSTLVCKPTLNLLKSARLAKWLSVPLWIKWFVGSSPLQSLNLQIKCLFEARTSLAFRQVQSVDSLQPRMWHDKNTQSIEDKNIFVEWKKNLYSKNTFYRLKILKYFSII